MKNEPRLTWQTIELQLQTPFRVSYGVSETRQAVWLQLTQEMGWGESTIPPYYGIGDDEITAVLQKAAQSTKPFPDDPADIPNWVGSDGPAPARCALDLALHDRIGRLRQQPLYELLNLPTPKSLPTSFTIGIDTPEVMAEMARQIPHAPIIKVKLGSDDDQTRLAAIRAARPDVKLRIDANAAWSPETAVAQLTKLLPYDLELIEQPTPKNDIVGMGIVQAAMPVPVVADESVQTLADVEALAKAGVQGINLKLMKVGGLAMGLKIIQRAQALGLKIMLGCMVETSLGTTAMAHLSGFADWIDLDAPLLIANDPFLGVTYDQSNHILLPSRPGIGVIKR